MRGKRSGADRKKKRTFGIEAYEHWEKVESGMGRLCPSTCPKGGRCGDILTLNDYQRDAITRDIIKEACSCEQSMSNAHDKSPAVDVSVSAADARRASCAQRQGHRYEPHGNRAQ
mmetsp:Transcript_17182/g.56147  ORF Transcript_17182/g.56147 Transcript_17182/m.56147 type:complete len:115 (-) Transcript_17182:463-807(-)|eukprot:scaffold3119_cov105-Isochrysis_galbana.AAC.3